MSDDPIDARLSALFGADNATSDQAFVVRIERAVAAERVLAAARTRAWRRFRREVLASGAVAAALGVLWRFADAVPVTTSNGFVMGPVAVGLLALLMWQVVEQRAAQ